MIITEYLNDNTLIRHYSDSGLILIQQETGDEYYETIDIVPCPYTYIEKVEEIIIEEPTEVEKNASLDKSDII